MGASHLFGLYECESPSDGRRVRSFNYEFPQHTEAFRAHMAAGKRAETFVGRQYANSVHTLGIDIEVTSELPAAVGAALNAIAPGVTWTFTDAQAGALGYSTTVLDVEASEPFFTYQDDRTWACFDFTITCTPGWQRPEEMATVASQPTAVPGLAPIVGIKGSMPAPFRAYVTFDQATTMQAFALRHAFADTGVLPAELPSVPASPVFEDTFSATPVLNQTNPGGWYDGAAFESHSVAGTYPDIAYYDHETNFEVDAGVGVKIKSEKRTVGGKSYASGMASSWGSYTYGYFECRTRLPKGGSIFPSFWLTGYRVISGVTVGNVDSEIDVVEYLGNDPDRIVNNLHYNSPSGNHYEIGWRTNEAAYYDNPPSDWSADFHVYAVDWQPTYVRFYVDDQLVREVLQGQVVNGHAVTIPSNPHWLVFGTRMNEHYAGAVNDAQLPAYMYVDYIRVYTEKGGTVLAASSPVGTAVQNYDVTDDADALGGKMAQVTMDADGTAFATPSSMDTNGMRGWWLPIVRVEQSDAQPLDTTYKATSKVTGSGIAGTQSYATDTVPAGSAGVYEKKVLPPLPIPAGAVPEVQTGSGYGAELVLVEQTTDDGTLTVSSTSNAVDIDQTFVITSGRMTAFEYTVDVAPTFETSTASLRVYDSQGALLAVVDPVPTSVGVHKVDLATPALGAVRARLRFNTLNFNDDMSVGLAHGNDRYANGEITTPSGSGEAVGDDLVFKVYGQVPLGFVSDVTITAINSGGGTAKLDTLGLLPYDEFCLVSQASCGANEGVLIDAMDVLTVYQTDTSANVGPLDQASADPQGSPVIWPGDTTAFIDADTGNAVPQGGDVKLYYPPTYKTPYGG